MYGWKSGAAKARQDPVLKLGIGTRGRECQIFSALFIPPPFQSLVLISLFDPQVWIKAQSPFASLGPSPRLPYTLYYTHTQTLFQFEAWHRSWKIIGPSD